MLGPVLGQIKLEGGGVNSFNEQQLTFLAKVTKKRSNASSKNVIETIPER